MKREYFHSSSRQDRRFGEQRNGTCMALIDGRFLIWMAQQGAVGTTGVALSGTTGSVEVGTTGAVPAGWLGIRGGFSPSFSIAIIILQ